MPNKESRPNISLITILNTLQDAINIVQEVSNEEKIENETIDEAKLIFKQFKKDFPEGAGYLLPKK